MNLEVVADVIEKYTFFEKTTLCGKIFKI